MKGVTRCPSRIREPGRFGSSERSRQGSSGREDRPNSQPVPFGDRRKTMRWLSLARARVGRSQPAGRGTRPGAGALRRPAPLVLEELEPRVVLSVTYYVSESGNDANTGTPVQNAWRTIARVNQQALAPGDTVLFQGGAT